MSSRPPLRERLTRFLDELEEGCAQAEVALRAQDWPAFERHLADQRRVRQGIVNDLAAERTTLDSLPDLHARLQSIYTFREDQLRRLVAYRTRVSEKLKASRKWRDIARAAQRGIGPAPVLFSRTQ